MSRNQNARSSGGSKFGVIVVLGAAIGTAVGAAMGNIALGVAAGAVLGVIIGTAYELLLRRHS